MSIAKQGKILIVDDNEDVLLSLNMLLKPYMEAIKVLTAPERILDFMDTFSPDVILLDMNFHRDAISGEEGYEWLKKILQYSPKSVVLFMTAYVDTEKAVRAIKAGAIDFIPKPWDKDKLLDTVKSAVQLSRDRHQSPNVESDANTSGSFGNFIGECPAIQKLKQQLRRVAVTDANVLITGENGTGKDVVAHALHQFSKRFNNPFLTIDLGCIPDNLFESELFGYEKGAFTDAKSAKAGRVETADGGTLFLDEIGNLNIQMQQKLLTMIEKRETSRIGSNTFRPVDIRIISATNANLREKVEKGEFRQDLLYRLNTIELHLPPLRERENDILLLAHHFLKIYTGKYCMDEVSLAKDAEQKLLHHAWPGNVRELQHCMERAIVLTDKQKLAASDIPLEETVSTSFKEAEIPQESLNLEKLERQAIKRAIALGNGNLTQAAEMLGITRFALYRKIDKLGI